MNEIIEPITKKELALNKAGATRERGALVISQAMSATKMTVDKNGEEHSEPDHTIRLRAEELRARYVGDLKPDATAENKTVNLVMMGTASEVAELIKLTREVKEGLVARVGSGGQTGEIIDI